MGAISLRGISALRSSEARFTLTVLLVFFLFSGQGLRYLLGLPGYAVCAGVLLLVALVSYGVLPALKTVPVLIAVFLGLAGVSLLWTQTPLVSAIAFAIMLATSFLALACVRALDSGSFLLALFWGLTISLVVGMVFELVLALAGGKPLYPLHHEWLQLVPSDSIAPEVLQWSSGALFSGGPIQGFVGNRNLFGFIALLVGILAPLLAREKLIGWFTAAGAFTLALFVHLFTGSATVTFIALSLVILTVAAYVMRRVRPERRRTISWIFVVAAAGAAYLSYSYRDVVTLMLGRAPDLTDRTAIWRAVFETILQYPLGTGWVSYWPIWLEPYKGLISLSGTPIAQAHNAYLDVWLQLGPLALIVLIALFLTTLVSSWELLEAEEHGDTVIPLVWVLLLVALGLQAVTESRLLLEGNWWLFVALVACAPQLIKNRGRSFSDSVVSKR